MINRCPKGRTTSEGQLARFLPTRELGVICPSEVLNGDPPARRFFCISVTLDGL